MSQRQFHLPLFHYPSVYGVSYRTILRRAEKGYPLEDEAGTLALVSVQKNSKPPPMAANTPRTLPTATVGELGLSAAIGRLQAAEAQPPQISPLFTPRSRAECEIQGESSRFLSTKIGEDQRT